MQEIRLILFHIDSRTQAPSFAIIANCSARVMARRHGFAFEDRCGLPHKGAELHRRVAPHAGAWGLAIKVRRNKRLEHGISELLLKVLNVEGDAEEIRHAACIIRCIERAATFSTAIDSIRRRVKPHPDTHNVMPSCDEERRSHR
jgi:hypothetical protein